MRAMQKEMPARLSEALSHLEIGLLDDD